MREKLEGALGVVKQAQASAQAAREELERLDAQHRADLLKAHNTTQVVRNRVGELEAEIEDAEELRTELGCEVRALKADQEDWRKGVAYIAASAGLDTLACTWIANRVLENRAELEAVRGLLWDALEASEAKGAELMELRKLETLRRYIKQRRMAGQP